MSYTTKGQMGFVGFLNIQSESMQESSRLISGLFYQGFQNAKWGSLLNLNRRNKVCNFYDVKMLYVAKTQFRFNQTMYHLCLDFMVVFFSVIVIYTFMTFSQQQKGCQACNLLSTSLESKKKALVLMYFLVTNFYHIVERVRNF